MIAIRYTKLRRRRSTGRIVLASMLGVTSAICSACAADAPDGHASAAVRGVEVAASGCGPVAEHGSGTAIGGALVITAAHVVAGATSVEARLGGVVHPATIAAIDTEHDAAVLRVSGLDESAIERRSARAGEAGSYLGFGGVTPGLKPFTVVRRITLDSEDIYVKGDHPRAGYELTGDIVAGDSGAGLIVDGAVTGVVWARSTQSDTRAYAIDISVFDPLLDSLPRPDAGAGAPPVPCP